MQSWREGQYSPGGPRFSQKSTRGVRGRTQINPSGSLYSLSHLYKHKEKVGKHVDCVGQ